MTPYELVEYWRQTATHANSADERATWLRCAEMLEEVIGGPVPALTACISCDLLHALGEPCWFAADAAVAEMARRAALKPESPVSPQEAE